MTPPPLRAPLTARLIAAAIFTALGPAALAQQPTIDDLLREREALIAHGPPPSGAELADWNRRQAQMLDQVIALAPDDDRAPTWLIDRAALELGSLAPDAADLSTLFGMPTAEQRRRARDAAGHALQLLQGAAERAEAAVARLEDSFLAARSSSDAAAKAAEAEAALARLVDVEQARRIPLYRGRALALLAAASEETRRDEAARRALETLAPLRLAGPAEAMRRLAIAAALLNSRAAADARSAAESELDAALAASDPADAAVRRAVALARRLTSPEPDSPAPADLLEAESAARALLSRARIHPQARDALAARACRLLLEAPGLDTADPAQRLFLYAKLGAAVEPTINLSALPAEAALARAVTLLRESPGSAEARAILAALLARDDAPRPIRADALWEAAALDARSGQEADRARAAERLLAFIRAHPDDPRAADAARTLATLAATAPPPAAADVPLTDAELAQREAIEFLIRRDPAERARFALPLIRLWSRDAASNRLQRDNLDALAEFARAGDDRAREAARLAADTALRRAIQSPDWSQRPASQRAALLAPAPGLFEHPPFPLLLGETNLELGDAPAAVAALAPHIDGPLDAPSSPDRPRLRLTLARALRSLGQGGEALALLRPLVAPFDERPASGPRPDHYWQAWAEMIEISLEGLSGRRDDGEAIRAQIKRLEIIDPALGGPDTRARILRARRLLETP